MRPDDVLLLVLSILIWLAILYVLGSPAVRVLGFAAAIIGGFWLHAHLLPSSQILRIILWAASSIAAPVRLATTKYQREREVAAFALLTSVSLLVFALIEAMLGPFRSLFAGIGAALCIAAVATVLRRLWERHRRRQLEYTRHALLEDACTRLESLPQDVLNELARKVIESLAASPSRRMTVGALSRLHSRAWQDVLVICASLADRGVVSLERDSLSSETIVEIHPAGEENAARASATIGPVGPLSMTIIENIENAIFSSGGNLVAGDEYHVTGTNVTGVFGRHNKVRNVKSTATGGQEQTIARDQVVAEARKLAESLDVEQAEKLRNAAEKVEQAKLRGDLRKAVERVLEIASIIGEHGSTLLNLAQQFLQGFMS